MIILHTTQHTIHVYTSYVTELVKTDHLTAKKLPIFSSLFYHNLITIYTTATMSSSLLQNSTGFLLQLTKMGYYILNRRY